MRRAALSAIAAVVAASCVGGPSPDLESPPAASASEDPPSEASVAASEPPAVRLPVRGEGALLPGPNAVLTRIAFGGGVDQTAPLPIFAAVTAKRPDVFVFTGDNIRLRNAGGSEDATLAELRAAYADLNLNAHFSAFNMAVPTLAAWSADEDGSHGSGGGASRTGAAEQVFETYWSTAALGAGRPGVHGSLSFGPPGRRVQVLLLDARTSQAEAASAVLGEAQWRWLSAELRDPADIRLIVWPGPPRSHGDAGSETKHASTRLLALLAASPSGGVVLLTGDEQLGKLMTAGRKPVLVRRLAEVQLSGSANPSRPAAFGLLEIDWARGRLTGSVVNLHGREIRRDQLALEQAAG
jgi:alkaline phosphatase D